MERDSGRPEIGAARRVPSPGPVAGRSDLGALDARSPGAARGTSGAAGQACARARTNRGVLYRLGQASPRDRERALALLRLPADQGETKAQHLLGSIYHEGVGVPAGDGQGVQWLVLADEHGRALAQ